MFYKVWTLKEAYLKALGVGLLEKPLKSLNFNDNIDLLKKYNDFTISNDHYWSQKVDDEYFLTFCVLGFNKKINVNYLKMKVKNV